MNKYTRRVEMRGSPMRLLARLNRTVNRALQPLSKFTGYSDTSTRAILQHLYLLQTHAL